MLWIKNALPDLPLLGFYLLSALQVLRGTHWCDSQVALQGLVHTQNSFFTVFFCLPCMFTAGVDAQSHVHHVEVRGKEER